MRLVGGEAGWDPRQVALSLRARTQASIWKWVVTRNLPKKWHGSNQGNTRAGGGRRRNNLQTKVISQNWPF
jgi:hypothetical protein